MQPSAGCITSPAWRREGPATGARYLFSGTERNVDMTNGSSARVVDTFLQSVVHTDRSVVTTISRCLE